MNGIILAISGETLEEAEHDNKDDYCTYARLVVHADF
jgi:hypothetical protein